MDLDPMSAKQDSQYFTYVYIHPYVLPPAFPFSYLLIQITSSFLYSDVIDIMMQHKCLSNSMSEYFINSGCKEKGVS